MLLPATPAQLLRVGAAAPVDLRPRPKDRSSGLSAYDNMETMKAAYVRIGRPLRSGKDTYVVIDTANLPGLVVERARDSGHYSSNRQTLGR
jgi:hypothetical protein